MPWREWDCGRLFGAIRRPGKHGKHTPNDLLTTAAQPDIVDHLTIENVQAIRLNAMVQPNMGTGIYLKTWTGSVHGVPPTEGGGGGGEGLTPDHNRLNKILLLQRVCFEYDCKKFQLGPCEPADPFIPD